jgi:nucleotide-binding universal stress UspA family protein
MAIKDLAISYNGSVNADTALCMAVKMCKKYDAMLTGIYVSAPVHFEGKIERWISSDTLHDLQAAEDKLAQSIHETFLARVAEAGHKGEVDWLQERGRPTEVLTRRSRFFDLLLMGQQSSIDGKKAHIRAEEIVTRSGRPLIIVPNGYVCRNFTEYAVVAWDGRRAAARALMDAMLILETKRRLDVVTVANDPAEAETDSVEGATIVRHLQRHGIDARRIVLQTTREDKGSALLEYCKEHGPDVLVTGAYGHSRLREDLFGGVTRHIMQEMNVPVFVSH